MKRSDLSERFFYFYNHEHALFFIVACRIYHGKPFV